ncbi:YihY/virulence factor BrkB family protein [Microbacterium sp. ET2]|uniref:YihY/virulence factor BrkB family protein n=1 Tax=Microbacterium albipurpureum TaxID=3050384 RepID=UPI00259C8954|nr:YihY/virulence factor BrkB family protein [Microbacterium sp. ET2 (Ac-2212)]WJL97101.1 YihY/virulence factor BrkB family protein [Microbacterium sp. ET2 (Ac-2212)]
MPDVDTPGDDREPTRATRLRSPTWRYLLRRTISEFIRDECLDAAGSLTFFGVLAVFPAGLAIMAVVGIVGDSDAVRDRLLTLLGQVAPGAVTDTADAILTNVTGSSSADVTLIVSVAIALWSSSIYVTAFGRSVNRIYGVAEGRPYWKRKPIQLLVTVVLLTSVTIMIAIVMVSGPVLRLVGDVLGIGDATVEAWNVFRWPIFAVALVVVIAILYKGTGNVRLPKFRWLGLGALLAMMVMGAASLGFGFYVSNFARYNETFGAFAGVTIFLIWLFLVNVALLLGVELNAEIERGRELQAGVPAEEHIRIPLRDTTAIESRERAREITRDHGSMLRRGEVPPPRPDSFVTRVREWLRRRSPHKE